MKKKKKNIKWESGISLTTTMSYEKYLREGLNIISPRLSIRVYKTAQQKDYPLFTKGNDLRVQIYWDKESKYEFIIDKSFWYNSNKNKEDRRWMRGYADIHLRKFYDAVKKGKEDSSNKK